MAPLSAVRTYTAPVGECAFVPIRCDICGSTKHREVMSSESCTFVRCLSCGVTYQNPQPTEQSLQVRYGADYFGYEIGNERAFFELMLLGLRDIRFDDLPGIDQRGAFLDVGCATGMLLDHMRRRGWATLGVEICAQSAAHATRARGLEVFVGTLEEARLPDESFRVVHFSHLLEHVSRPRGFLEEVRRILAPGGYAIITTPNIDGFQARLLGPRWRSAIPDHLYLFRPRTLRLLLESVGLKVLKTVTWGGIARGLAPAFIKGPVDRLAKKMGFGDVMLFLTTPG